MDIKVKYYLRDKTTKKLSQPFSIMECAMIYKQSNDEIYEVWIVNKPMEDECININSMSI